MPSEWLSSYFQPVTSLFLRRSFTSQSETNRGITVICNKQHRGKKQSQSQSRSPQRQRRRRRNWLFLIRKRSSIINTTNTNTVATTTVAATTTTTTNLSKDNGQHTYCDVSIPPKKEKKTKDINVRYKDNKRLACCSVPYRVNVATNQYEFLLVKSGSCWTFPGGGWEHHESQEECVLRESWEESGVKPQIRNNQIDIILLNSEPIPIYSATRKDSAFSKLLWIYAFHVDLDANQFPENRAKRWMTWDEVPKQLAPKDKENRVWELASKYFKNYKLDQQNSKLN